MARSCVVELSVADDVVIGRYGVDAEPDRVDCNDRVFVVAYLDTTRITVHALDDGRLLRRISCVLDGVVGLLRLLPSGDDVAYGSWHGRTITVYPLVGTTRTVMCVSCLPTAICWHLFGCCW